MVKNRRFEDNGPRFGVRHLQIFFLFSALAMGFAMRVNLSVAVVAMEEFPEFKWSEKTKSLLLSSFFWGYVLTQVPAGLLARRFGGKITILTGISVCSVLTVLTPLCVKLGGWKLFCFVRLLEGICQGVLFPSCHTVISAWVPPKERATMGNMTYAGNTFGTIVMLGASGLLISFGGWTSVFYAPGLVGCLWSLSYYIWGASSPAVSKSISTQERELIELEQAKERNVDVKAPINQMKTPWLSFFTSPAVLSLIAMQSSYAFAFWTLLTQIPSYVKNVLGKDIKTNALLSSMPYVAMLTLSFFFAYLSKLMSRKTSLSLAFNRKTFNTIGTFIPMCLLILLGYIPKEMDTLAIALLTLTVGFASSTHAGFLINHIDLSPNFAGILMGICNCIANVMSLLAPLVVGVLVTDNHDANQWRLVFMVPAVFYFVGNSLFLIFGRTDIQSWNEAPEHRSSDSTDVEK